jgi:hypothetical protein
VTIRSLFIFSLFAIGVTWTSRPVFAQNTPPRGERKVTQVKPSRTHLPTDTVGIVNGVVITYADFNSIMSGYLKAFVQRSGDNVVTDSLYSVIVDSSWSKAVSDILTELEIQKRKLEMTDSAVKQVILQDPPDFLRQQFTDSTGKYYPEYLSRALNDPHNDTIVRIIVGEETVRWETYRLIASLDPKAHSPEEKKRAYNAWLKHATAKAAIVDKRLSFGFY